MRRGVLVVSGRVAMRQAMSRVLAAEGLTVVEASTGVEGLHRLLSETVEALVLERELPDMPGDDLLAAAVLRGVPTLVVSAAAGVEDRIRGLESGVEDYLAAPPNGRELALRVLVMLRRGRPPARSEWDEFDAGVVRIDHARHEVRVAGRPVDLTPTQWTLLTLLASAPGRVFTHREIAARCHGLDLAGDDRTVVSHVRNLRAKLRAAGDDGRTLETVRGVGYRFGRSRDEPPPRGAEVAHPLDDARGAAEPGAPDPRAVVRTER